MPWAPTLTCEMAESPASQHHSVTLSPEAPRRYIVYAWALKWVYGNPLGPKCLYLHGPLGKEGAATVEGLQEEPGRPLGFGFWSCHRETRKPVAHTTHIWGGVQKRGW